MAFWGIEVKPGKPFSLKFDDGVRRRLHISQATLATGSSKQTSLVQCNVGNKSPILLCALLPDKSESLQLNLEFDEDEEVLFSVIGPRGVHLTGFYTAVGCNVNNFNVNNDESESYGEDIANSENEESVPQSDEDEYDYEDSFIDDDDDLEVLSPSPLSCDGVDDDIGKRRNKTTTNKRVKKRSQVVGSDDESASWPENTGNCIRRVLETDIDDDISKRKNKTNTNKQVKKRSQVVGSDDGFASWPENTGNCIRRALESDSEDGFLISSVRKNKKAVKDIVSESNACNDISKPKVDGPVKNAYPKSEGKTLEAEAANHSNVRDKLSEAKTSYIAVGQDPIETDGIDDVQGINKPLPKKKGKGVSNEEKIFEADAANRSNTDDKAKRSDAKTDNIAVGHDPVVTNQIDVDTNNGAKPKKKRKERSKEGKIPETNTDSHIKSFQEKEYLRADTTADDMDQDLHVGKEHDQRPFNKTETGPSAGTLVPTVEKGSEKPKMKRRKKEQDQKASAENDLHVPERKPDENTSEKAAKKKKNKSKVLKMDENVDVPVLLKGEKEIPINEVQEKHVITGSSQVRTLSNGLVIEELESSKSDGQAAAPGRKLKVQYTARLKESGEIIDSNGEAPCRICLGGEDIMEGWKIGLDGMRAGDKRRLVVPPSLGNGSRGTAENVPPDSWVIYDVKLLSVR